MTRLHILHVVPSYLPAVRYGGPIYSVHGLARAQAELGHAVEVFTTNVDGEGISDVPVAVPVPLDGVKVTYFPVAGGRRIYRAPKMAQALRARIGDFDIVHLHSVFLWPTTSAAAIARAQGVPYVLSPRGMLWREMIAQRSRLAKQAWIALFERRNVERAAAIHVTAELEAAKLDELGFRLPPVIALANGVDEPTGYSMSDVASDIREAVAERGYALSFGRIHWKKNLGELLRALATQTRLRLVIAGNDEDGEAEKLRQLAGEFGLGPRVAVLARQIGWCRQGAPVCQCRTVRVAVAVGKFRQYGAGGDGARPSGVDQRGGRRSRNCPADLRWDLLRGRRPNAFPMSLADYCRRPAAFRRHGQTRHPRRRDEISAGAAIAQKMISGISGGGRGERDRRMSASASARSNFVRISRGLRGVAVLLVVLFHAGVPFLPGGFVGVDVFFVISGYSDHRVAGRRSEGKRTHLGRRLFMRAGSRRLLPGLLLMLAACLAVGHFLVPASAVRQNLAVTTSGDTRLHFQFLLLARHSPDYFAEATETLPLLHTWTLAVEEQFYIVWPLAILAAFWLSRRIGIPTIVLLTLGVARSGSLRLSFRCG